MSLHVKGVEREAKWEGEGLKVHKSAIIDAGKEGPGRAEKKKWYGLQTRGGGAF